MTRVLLVSPLARAGGAERVFAALVRNLPRHGCEPVVALLEHGPLADWLGSECEVIPARPLDPLRIGSTAGTVERLRRLARRAGAGAIVSSKTRGHLFGGCAAAAAGLPAVWWVHEMPPQGTLYRRGEPWRRYHVEEVARRIPAAHVVCGNESASALQRRRTPGRSVVTIRPGVPVDELAGRRGDGGAVRRRLGHGGGPLVGIVGRFDPLKGHDTFVRAAELVARGRADARFAFVGGALLDGERELERRVRSRCDAGALAGRVAFAGHQDDPVPWLDALDIVVIASRSEGGPLVLGEAMALGKPVVATRVGAIGEVLEDGVSGLLVPPGDALAMAAAIRRLADDPAFAARLGRAARARANEFCDLRMSERFALLLTGLTSGCGS
jgi:glycosyltransferase involved in cell wall biosynthesis